MLRRYWIMLQVTDSAIKEFKRILIDSNREGHGIRIFTTGGG
ncbi:MAG: hypothetical protein Fur0020_14270 [Thermodesulfovibrionia bacterium]